MDFHSDKYPPYLFSILDISFLTTDFHRCYKRYNKGLIQAVQTISTGILFSQGTGKWDFNFLIPLPLFRT